jgi:hypothetical protein
MQREWSMVENSERSLLDLDFASLKQRTFTAYSIVAPIYLVAQHVEIK